MLQADKARGHIIPPVVLLTFRLPVLASNGDLRDQLLASLSCWPKTMLAQQAKLLPRLLGHQTLSSILSEAPGSGTLVSHVVAPWHRSIARSPDRADSHGSQEALEQIVQDFGSNPQDVSQQLAAKLSTSQKAALAAALAQHTDQHELNEDYFNELFKAADNDANSELNRWAAENTNTAHLHDRSGKEGSEGTTENPCFPAYMMASYHPLCCAIASDAPSQEGVPVGLACAPDLTKQSRQQGPAFVFRPAHDLLC